MNWYNQFLDEEIFLARDNSQLEIRMIAQYSEDPLLCAQLNRDEDIHVQVGHEILGWPIEVIKKEGKARVISKGIHFGIVFGLGDQGVFDQCVRKGVYKPDDEDGFEEVCAARRKYFKRYKRVKEFIDYATAYTEKHHRTVPTLFGRTRPLEVRERIDEDEPFWGNQAVNTPIQGSAADFPLLCLAIIKNNPNRYRLLRRRLRNTIHDSLTATPKLRDLAEADEKLQYLMETHCVAKAQELFGVKMLVPLKSDAKVGFRYGVMVDYDRSKSLDEVLTEWCKQNAKVEAALVENPMKFVDLQRGVVN